MPKICHVIFEHHPLDGRVFYKEAVSHAQMGYQVFLLAPARDNRSIGRKREISRQPTTPFIYHDVEFRTYRYSKWIPRQFGLRQWFTRRRMIKMMEEIDAEVYHFHEDQVVLEACLQFIMRRPAKKIVFDFHECFLVSYLEKRKNPSEIGRYLLQEQQLIRRADLIITVSETLTRHFRLLGAETVCTVLNCQSRAIFKQIPQSSVTDDTFWVCHEGRMLFDRGLKLILEIARRLTNPRIKILLIGSMPAREQRYFEEQQSLHHLSENIRLTGWQAYEQVSSFLSISKIGLFFMSSRNGRLGIANKFFNYLCFGLPIIALKCETTDEIIQRYECGLIFKPDQSAEIAAQIDALAQDSDHYQRLADNSRRAFEERYNWEIMAERLQQAYREMLS